MSNREIIELRNRILGLSIRKAREEAHLSRKACAEALGISARRFAAYEEGRLPISLPELELLGRLLDTPLHKLRDEAFVEEKAEPLPAPELYLPLRHRLIGARLRQARQEAGRSQRELAAMLERSPGTISAYEYGERPIPLAELEIISRALNLPVEEFTDHESEIGEWHRLEQQFERFRKLPSAVREFVLRPINLSYLELAMKLADMPAGALRRIAEDLLEITY